MWIAISNAIGQRVGTGGGPGPGPGPDPVPSLPGGFAAAYSVRKLDSAYAGSCLEAYRVSDGATQDIGFDSNGDLDTAAIISFAGGGEVRVRTWYDQSGNGVDATQTTDTFMPRIYDGAAIYEENGKPALAWTAQGQHMDTTPNESITAQSNFVVFNMDSTSGGFARVLAQAETGKDDYQTGQYAAFLRSPTVNSLMSAYQDTERAEVGGANVFNNQHLWTAIANGTASNVWLDSGTEGSASITLTTSLNMANLTIRTIGGAAGFNQDRLVGNIQEVLIYNTDEEAAGNRGDIEYNVNDYYSIFSGNQGAPTSGFLFDYSGAAAAYSVRQLSNNATLSLRVRRTVAPFDEQDIGFDSNGDLDTAAIATFGGSDPLTVSRWYDQSGNLKDATQATAGSQPSIYDGAAVITENGKPAVSFDGGDVLRYTGITNTDLVTTDGHASSVVFKDTSASGFRGVVGTDDRAIDFVTRLGNTDWQYSITTNNTPELQYTASASNYNVQNLSFVNKGASNAYWRLNASQIASALGGGVVTPGTTNWELGESVGLKYQGLLQEVVVWNTDNDSNAAGIESNVNTYYSIYPTSGLLADYPGAAAAYSVRQLSNTATLSMRVRRTVAPFDEQDIGFDSNGDLDTAAIATFGGSDPLTVSVWYDQSGQSRHATQATAGNQPQIYDGAAVITENGNPAIKFSKETNSTASGLNYSAISATRFYHVWAMNQPTSTRLNWMSTASGNYYRLNTSGDAAIVKPNDFDLVAGNIGLTGYKLRSIDRDSDATATAYVDGSSSNAWVDLDSSAFTFDNINANFAVSGAGYHYNIQEFIIYDSSQSTNRTGIETNINGYYGVYTMYNPDAPTSGFLFDYSGAAVAYSVRQLNNNATYAMRVRRTVAPFDEQDIGFDGSGNLDTSAISTFGGSDSLTVSRWYDQTGNQNHATQGTAGSQPQIYDGSTVTDVIGRPGVDFYNVIDRYMQFSEIASSGSDFTVSYVGALNGGSRNSIVGLRGTGTSNTRYIRTSFNKINVSGYQSAYGTIASGLNEYSIIVTNQSQAGTVYKNNASIVTGTTDSALAFDTIGGTDTGDAGVHSEIVIWESVLSTTDRTGVYNNQDTYYSIP